MVFNRGLEGGIQKDLMAYCRYIRQSFTISCH